MASTRTLQLTCQNLEIDIDASPTQAPSGNSNSSEITSSKSEENHEVRVYQSFKDEVYLLPNDATEVERLGLQDLIWSLQFNHGLHISPLSENITNVLDVGTGAANWAISFAKAHPRCNVVGTDLSPIQPKDAPSNTKFLLQSANENWDLGDTKFDFIHSRLLVAGMRDYSHYLREAYRHLKPGGFIEMKEAIFPVVYYRTDGKAPEPYSALPSTSYYDLNVSSNPHPFYLATALIEAAMTKSGLHPRQALMFKELCHALGFKNIMYEETTWPIGTWAKGQVEKRVGALSVNKMKFQDLPAIGPSFIKRYLGWTDEQVEELLVRARQEIDETKDGKGERCYYWSLFVVSAQRPE